MGLQKALVFSNKVPESGIARHTSFTHFLDLIDACGYDLKITSGQPSHEALATYKIIFLDAATDGITDGDASSMINEVQTIYPNPCP